jgi:hypothetical protein
MANPGAPLPSGRPVFTQQGSAPGHIIIHFSHSIQRKDVQMAKTEKEGRAGKACAWASDLTRAASAKRASAVNVMHEWPKGVNDG